MASLNNIPLFETFPITRVLQWLRQPGTFRPRTYIMVRPDPGGHSVLIRNEGTRHPEYHLNFGGDSGAAPINPLGPFGPPDFMSSDNMTRLRGPATDKNLTVSEWARVVDHDRDREARIIDKARYGADPTVLTSAQQALIDIVTAFPQYDMSTDEGTVAAIADMQGKLLFVMESYADSV